MAQNNNGNNGKNPFRKNPIVTFIRLAILAILAWILVSGIKMVIGG